MDTFARRGSRSALCTSAHSGTHIEQTPNRLGEFLSGHQGREWTNAGRNSVRANQLSGLRVAACEATPTDTDGQTSLACYGNDIAGPVGAHTIHARNGAHFASAAFSKGSGPQWRHVVPSLVECGTSSARRVELVVRCDRQSHIPSAILLLDEQTEI